MSEIVESTGFVTSEGLRIAYRLFGAGSRLPLVIVHGLSYFSYDWIEIARALADDRQVVAIDMRGFGDSDWASDKDYSIAANARDLIAILDHFNWKRAILVGHSMGGRYCTFCAAEYSSRIAGLVSVDFAPANAPGGAARVAETIGRTPDSFASIDDAMAYFGADPHSPAGAQARVRYEHYLQFVDGRFQIKRDPLFRDQFRQVLETGERPKSPVDMWDVLRRVPCPILVLRGTQSDMFSPEIATQVRTARPDAKIVEIDAGHNIGGEKPEVLVREIRTFLSGFP